MTTIGGGRHSMGRSGGWDFTPNWRGESTDEPPPAPEIPPPKPNHWHLLAMLEGERDVGTLIGKHSVKRFFRVAKAAGLKNSWDQCEIRQIFRCFYQPIMMLHPEGSLGHAKFLDSWRDGEGCTPLHNSARQQDYSLVNEFLKLGANPTLMVEPRVHHCLSTRSIGEFASPRACTRMVGRTALTLLVSEPGLAPKKCPRIVGDIIELLATSFVPPELPPTRQKDGRGETPLFAALSSRNHGFISLLLRIDPGSSGIPNEAGELPLEVALRSGLAEPASLIMRFKSTAGPAPWSDARKDDLRLVARHWSSLNVKDTNLLDHFFGSHEEQVVKEFASVAFEEALKLVGAGPDCVDAKKIRDQEQFRLGGPPRRDYAFIQAMRQIASLDHLAKWNEIRDWALEQKNEILVAICG